MKKNLFITFFFVISSSIRATDFSLLQILQFSNYSDLSSSNVTGVSIVDFRSVYVAGYYFLDARLQNMGTDQWALRGLFDMRAVFQTNRYIPDIRYVYAENKKPVGDHWLFSAGRINPSSMIPVQRLDGANVAYTPNKDQGWKFGLVGGMVPVETSGYRNYYYAPYRAGAYAEYNNKQADYLKVQYNLGLGAGVGADIFHQAEFQGAKKYSLFERDSFIRGGILFTYPYKTFDYAYAENSLFSSSKVSHTLGYLKSETLFLWQNNYVKEDFQQAYYRLSLTSAEDTWLINFRGGYTYSMQKNGYIVQAQFMRRKLFDKLNGFAGVDAIVQQKGVYDQISPRINAGLTLFKYVNFNVFLGYEYYKYRAFLTNAILYGFNVQGEFAGNFSYEGGAEIRTLIASNTEIYANVSLIHLFNTHLGKTDEDNGIKPFSEKNNDKANGLESDNTPEGETP
ncbi:MAG: hypothetical protein OEV66_04500 [Spirochaetia bacterium]|nr:hypothetical protein [Spirochaetia bacterium]